MATLRELVRTMARLTSDGWCEEAMLAQGESLLRTLVSRDGWLPDALAQPHPEFYQQFLLYADPLSRFSVVSFVWGPGQQTPVHDHTVWGIIGMLRGGEYSQAYRTDGTNGALLPCGPEHRLAPGDVAVVSPGRGDIHRVRNAFADQVSISIHVYGGNIGEVQRHVFDATTGETKTFVSGYSNTMVPNLWGPHTS